MREIVGLIAFLIACAGIICLLTGRLVFGIPLIIGDLLLLIGFKTAQLREILGEGRKPILPRFYLPACLIAVGLAVISGFIPRYGCGTFAAGGASVIFFIALVGAAFLAVMGLISLIAGRETKKAAIGLALNLGTVVISLLSFQLQAYIHDYIFHSRLPEYTQAIRLVQQGEVKAELFPNGGYLPSGYRHLACGGLILFEVNGDVTRVFFFDSAVDSDNYSGYLFSSDDTLPADKFFSRALTNITCKRIQLNWFYCSR